MTHTYKFILILPEPLTQREMNQLEIAFADQVTHLPEPKCMQFMETTPELPDESWESCSVCRGVGDDNCRKCRGLGLQKPVR